MAHMLIHPYPEDAPADGKGNWCGPGASEVRRALEMSGRLRALRSMGPETLRTDKANMTGAGRGRISCW